MRDRFDDPALGYALGAVIFEQVAAGERPTTISVGRPGRHVGVTNRDTKRPGFAEAVRAATECGFPVLVRGAGGGAIAAHSGTIGFSIVRPAEDASRDPRHRYDDAAALVLGALSRLDIAAEVGEVRDEFCPGDHSVRFGGWSNGMKLAGIAQRVTRHATSVGGILLVEREAELGRVLSRVYSAMGLPMRRESVGSLRRAGSEASVEDTVAAFAEEAKHRYDAEPVSLDSETLQRAREERIRYYPTRGPK